MIEHLDLDALADLVDAPAPDKHLAACAECTERLDQLRAAQARVAAALAGLPDPPLPEDLAGRLAQLPGLGRGPHSDSDSDRDSDSDGAARASVTTLPKRIDGAQRRWLLPAAAAAVLLLALGGYATQRGGRPADSTSASGSSASAARPAAPITTNNSGTDYSGQQALAAAVPQLLAGKTSGRVAAAAPVRPAASAGAPVAPAPAAGSAPAENLTSEQDTPADPLARLRTASGLAGCLQALLPPDDPAAAALAIDYGRFRGKPAMVVVLPSSIAGKLDVFVVGADCAPSHDSTLFYASVPRP